MTFTCCARNLGSAYRLANFSRI